MMELSERDLIILLQGLVSAVEVAKVQNGGNRGSKDLAHIKAAEDFVRKVSGGHISFDFNEIDKLFTKLVGTAQTMGLSKPEIDLASLPPNDYLQ